MTAARHDLEHLPGTQDRPALELHGSHDAFARRLRLADQPDALGGHDDLLERGAGRDSGRPGLRKPDEACGSQQKCARIDFHDQPFTRPGQAQE